MGHWAFGSVHVDGDGLPSASLWFDPAYGGRFGKRPHASREDSRESGLSHDWRIWRCGYLALDGGGRYRNLSRLAPEVPRPQIHSGPVELVFP